MPFAGRKKINKTNHMANKKKRTDEEIRASYEKHGNLWECAKELGLCGQSIWERLRKLGITLNDNSKFTPKEKELIKMFYAIGFKQDGTNRLEEFAKKLGRTSSSICTYAKRLGLTNNARKKTSSQRAKCILLKKDAWKNRPHPRGMLGKKHSPEYCKQLGEQAKNWHKTATPERIFEKYKKMVQTQRANGSFDKKRGTWKAAWRKIGDKEKYYRSRWEANYARYLEFLKQQGQILNWEHEPQTFWFEGIKRGCISYLPDFKIFEKDGTHYWVEVKGYYDDRSLTKIRRFNKYFPNEKLKVIDKVWFKENSNKLKGLIPDWESDNRRFADSRVDC